MELTRFIDQRRLAHALALKDETPLQAASHSGWLVRSYRERLEISQQVLSKESGCPCAALSRWERYGLLPYPKALAGVGAALARLLYVEGGSFRPIRAMALISDPQIAKVYADREDASFEELEKEFRRAFWLVVVADQMLDHEDGSGALVATLRAVRGLTQKELAVQAGVPSPQLEAWERRGLVPDSGVVKAVANVLDYDPVQLWTQVREERFVDPDWYTSAS